MSRLSPIPRSHSCASVASDTTYHSFHGAEVRRPVTSAPCDSSQDTGPLPGPYGMHRQDSGYESLTPRSSRTYSRRRSSTSAASSGPRPRHRPTVRRAPKSGPVAYTPRDSIVPGGVAPSSPPHHHHENDTYFQFPHFPCTQLGQRAGGAMSDSHLASGTASHVGSDGIHEPAASPSGNTTYTSPPQTTHYWTSDQTRKLEYAAIDAASRGVRGWVMRHMVPDCFIPEDRRRVRFDDDRCSVVRYRLDVEGDDTTQSEELGGGKRPKSRWFSTIGS